MAVEVDAAVITVLRSFSKDEDLIRQYIHRLQDEEITSLEDLAEVDASFLTQTVGMKKLHAQKLARKCQRVTLKIAIGSADNVIGCVRVFRGTSVYWLRKSIEKDRLPVEQSFGFLAHGTEITDAQESSWDVEYLIGDGQTAVVIIKYKGQFITISVHRISKILEVVHVHVMRFSQMTFRVSLIGYCYGIERFIPPIQCTIVLRDASVRYNSLVNSFKPMFGFPLFPCKQQCSLLYEMCYSFTRSGLLEMQMFLCCRFSLLPGVYLIVIWSLASTLFSDVYSVQLCIDRCICPIQ